MRERSIKSIGRTYNRLTVISIFREKRDKQKRTYANCICECGRKHVALLDNLKREEVRSCGCLSAQVTGDRARTHGMRKSKTYSVWSSMIKRCYNPNSQSFKYYGHRGIAVCDKWRHSFEAFYEDIGEIRDGLEIDRIDNNSDYKPGNVRLVTRSENARNTSQSKWWYVNGVKYPSALEASKMTKINLNRIYERCSGGIRNDKRFPPKSGYSSELKYNNGAKI